MESPSKRTTEWLALAALFLLAAIWQAQVAWVAGRNAGSTPQPALTRHALRLLPGPAVHPVNDYITRTAKGLTDQEIFWIATDFIAAGLDRPTDAVAAGDEAFEVRAAQDRWYLSSLVDALGLTPEQSAQASVKLAEFTRRSKDGFTHVNPNDLIRYEAALFVIGTTVNPDLMPWKLCDLESEQQQITSKRYFDVLDPGIPKSPAPEGTPDFQIQSLSIPVLSFGTVLLFGSNSFELANFFTPLLSSQNLPPQGLMHVSELQMLDEARKLHPAQLKIMMLLSPWIAGDLLKNLDAPPLTQRFEPDP